MNLTEQQRRGRLHRAYPAKAGECAECRKRPEYCRCRKSHVIRPVDAGYAARIMAKIAFACLLGLIVGCAVKPVQWSPVPAPSPSSQQMPYPKAIPLPAIGIPPTNRDEYIGIVPTALNPPAPITTTRAEGAAVVAPSGEPVSFAWEPSPNIDVVGYRLWHGVRSGNYTNSIPVGNVTTATISNLPIPSFVAATAYDSSGLQSPFSNEVLVDGFDTVVRINAYTNSAINTNWTLSHTIWTATNPPTGFWKLEATAIRQPR